MLHFLKETNQMCPIRGSFLNVYVLNLYLASNKKIFFNHLFLLKANEVYHYQFIYLYNLYKVNEK